MYEYNAKVTRVVDGDTVDVDIDCGFKTIKQERIRLHGINAPETRTRDKAEKAAGLASKKSLSELLPQAKRKIILQTTKVGRGKYGRIVGTLLLPETLENINERLVVEGHAKRADY